MFNQKAPRKAPQDGRRNARWLTRLDTKLLPTELESCLCGGAAWMDTQPVTGVNGVVDKLDKQVGEAAYQPTRKSVENYSM